MEKGKELVKTNQKLLQDQSAEARLLDKDFLTERQETLLHNPLTKKENLAVSLKA